MSEIHNAVLDAILSRRSTRSFLDKQITDAELNTILDAGIWSPTARNQQEIDFYVIQDRNKINLINEKFSSSLNRENVQDVTFGAPTLVMLFGKKGSRFMRTDSGIAVQNMALAAESLGLGSLIIGCVKEFLDSIEGSELALSLGVPEGNSFCICIALGHIDNTTKALPRRENRVFFL
jgi:Nitroreductase